MSSNSLIFDCVCDLKGICKCSTTTTAQELSKLKQDIKDAKDAILSKPRNSD